jgi:tetratricopeptide (TPR) repeat protein/tRNA A-37 threonylcarbamoyl transferase component Bud32
MTEREIFLAALKQPTGGERAAFLDQACRSDANLRGQIEALVAEHEQLGSYLEAPVAAGQPTLDEPPACEAPGTVIGPYKLMEQIGEGGMGLVYVAEQQHPVRRRVAFKVIKPGMDTRQVVARFEAERQALALMDHPNIAKVLDGGQTAGGRPYFVMELVKGVPITQFCDHNQVPIRERLELFEPVCQAVQHAHQKGIIHRDLKPSNVLVASYDGKPVVQVIDFGVAKAVGQQLTDKTVYTQFTQMVGTPLYMSPEQAGQSSLDVDTRSDIYSLGVLLYELLTGTTPFDMERLRTVGYDEMRRIIREEEPARPSARISTLGQAADTVSANRRSDPKKLSRIIRGDLDWIVMRALEKDRNRRYESASALAADVHHYLNDEPVQACPPSALYRVHKFARRHKAATRAVAVVAAVLVFGAGAYGLHLRGVAHSTSDSLKTARTALAEQNLHLAGLKLAEAQGRTGGGGLLLGGLAREVEQLQRAVQIIQELDEVRLEKAAVKGERFDEARADAKYAELFEKNGIPVHKLEPVNAAGRLRLLTGGVQTIELPLAAALDDWASVRRLQRGAAGESYRHLLHVASEIDPDPWRDRLRRAMAGDQLDRKVLVQLADTADAEELPAVTVSLLGALLRDNGAVEEATTLLRRAEQKHPSDFWINHDLAYLLAYIRKGSGDSEEGIGYYRAALAVRPQSPGLRLNLGNALRELGKVDEAIVQFRAAIDLKADYAGAHLNLGAALEAQGKTAAAVAEWRKAIELDPALAEAHNNLGHTLFTQGKLDEAIAEYRKAIEIAPEFALAHEHLGAALHAQGKSAEAVPELQRAVDLMPKKAEWQRNLGVGLHAQGKLVEAIARFRKAIELDPNDVNAHQDLGGALYNLLKKQGKLGEPGKLDEAVVELRRALELNPDLPDTHFNLANCLSGQGKLAEAVMEYRQAIRLKPDEFFEARSNLGATLRRQGKLEEAAVEYRKVIELDPKAAFAHNALGLILRAQGKLDEATAEFRKTIECVPKDPAAHNNLGTALADQGRYEEAEAAFREAIRINPSVAIGPNQSAWRLANAPDPKRRNGHQAVAFARLAVEAAPTNGKYWNTLGAAQYRAGNWKEAIAALARSMELRKGGDSSAWFFLAMAHWKLGEKEEARTWFDRAVQWMDKNQPKNDELGRFRAEAAQLLGIKAK